MKKCRKSILRAVSFMLAFVLVVSFANIGTVEAKTKEKKKNIVVLYFSATGTTKMTAKRIGKKTKGKVIEMKAKNLYTDADLDYGDVYIGYLIWLAYHNLIQCTQA